jgi:YVTN family beta-propeller protein
MKTSTRPSRLGFRILAFLASLMAPAALFADGPGLPNNTYPAADLHKTLSAYYSGNGASRGHGFVTMHRGYLVVVGAKDSGGGQGSGNLALFDISTPTVPVCVFTTVNNPNYAKTTSHYAGNFRETHSLAFSGDYLVIGSSGTGENGVQIWKLTSVDKPAGSANNAWLGPQKVGFVAFPGIYGGDYDGGAWSITWTGRYLYAAVPGTKGLYVVDAANPEAPFLVNRGPGKTNPLLLSEIGGGDNGMHMIVALGGTMIQGRKNFTGIEISDPINPRLIYDNSTDAGYSVQRYGDKAFGFDTGQLTAYNIADLNNVVPLANTPANFNGGYGIVQDGILHYGGGSVAAKANITGNPPYTLTTFTPTRPAALINNTSVFKAPDWDFYTPLGNLAFVSNDHETGSALVVNNVAPDTIKPAIVGMHPRSNSTSVPVTTAIGVQFSDQIDTRTVTAANIYLRKQGTTAAVAARYANSLGIINFQPVNHLDGNSIYEIVVGTGLKDLAGNTVVSQSVHAFSTGATITPPATPLTAELVHEAPATVGTTVTFDVAIAGGSGTVDVLWSFGDGTSSATNTTATVSKTYTNPGNYNVSVTVTRGSSTVTDSQIFTVHHPLTTGKPTHTSTIIYDDASIDKVWSVNTDAGTLAAINPTTGAKLHEVAAGTAPRTLAKAPDGSIWVANEGSDTVTIHSASDGSLSHTIALPRGSAPFGILFSPDGANAYVSLGGSWEVAKINPSTRVVSTPVPVGAHPRGLAMTGDSSRLFVTRFLSADSGGSIYEISPATLAAVRTLALAKDTSPDTEDTGRGVPNYLISPVISPDGTALAIPSTKANIDRGLARDGIALDFDNTVRTITSFLNLGTNTEFASRRVDHNDRDSAIAAIYSPLGNYLFVVTQGSNTLDVLDAYTGQVGVSFDEMGLAPRGVALSPDGTKAYIQNFMSRDIRVLNISDIANNTSLSYTDVSTTKVVANEPLSAQILLGKQIFYNAADPRMSQDKYLSCATCHTDAGHDGRVWDFTNRGEGFRNTIDLNGRSGMGHGFVHWTANFDEIQDFENDIREHQSGEGFMTDADFATTENTLGTNKAGKSADLDALAAYVSSLGNVGKSPSRNADGTLSTAGEAGKFIFEAKSCTTCHDPAQGYRDGLSHDVGTLKTTSGQRLGAILTGIDTPTLIGLWKSAPYFHDGSAGDLRATLTTAHVGSSLTLAEKDSLVDYLLQIEDGIEVAPATPTAGSVSPGISSGSLMITWTDNSNNESAFHLQRSPSGTNTWTTVSANIPAGSSSYTDSGLPADTAFDYRVRAETASLSSAWSSTLSGATPPAPSITILDNNSADVTLPAGAWTVTSGSGYVGVDFHTGTSGVATYAPSLAPGRYEIEVKFTSGWSQLRADVPYTVNHVEGVFSTMVDQTQGDVWVKLGSSFTLNATSTVVIGRPATGRPSWDAVRFTRITASNTPSITTAATLPGASVGQAFTTTLAASGGSGPFVWSASGLPGWLALDSSTGALTGTPPISGSFNFAATIADAEGDSDSRNFVHSVAPASTADGPWLENSGRVVMEAEHGSASANGDTVTWATTTVDGVGIARTTAGSAPIVTTWTAATELVYSFTLATPGNYSIAVRRRAPDGASDSAFLGLNGSQVGLNHFTGVAAVFAWTSSVSLGELPVGTHTLHIRRREVGLELDRILISRVVSDFPGSGSTAAGPAASARSGPAAPEPTGIDRWNFLHFTPAQLADPATSGPLATPAGDGLANKLKFALGHAPFTPVPVPVVRAADLPDGRLTYHYERRRNNPLVPLIVEVSPDLIHWSSAPADRVETVVSSDADSDVVAVSPPVGTRPILWFVRLRVD